LDNIASRLGKIAIVGGGKMGEAILSGLVSGAMFDPDQVVVAEPNVDLRCRLSETYGIVCVQSAVEIADPDSAVIAVKPQILRSVCEQLSSCASFTPRRIISIAAGITTSTLQSIFPNAAVVRVMPNAALMVGAGMSVVCLTDDTPRSEGELAREMFSLMGEAIILDEAQINAATAISGSGPAYFALFVEELARAGESLGLTPVDAHELSLQTLHGTARYLELTDATPEQLRIAVTSPNGTTQAALESFYANRLADVVVSAVQAAHARAEELA
jgi:pyrroline-5-carboxylate reductase